MLPSFLYCNRPSSHSLYLSPCLLPTFLILDWEMGGRQSTQVPSRPTMTLSAVCASLSL